MGDRRGGGADRFAHEDGSPRLLLPLWSPRLGVRCRRGRVRGPCPASGGDVPSSARYCLGQPGVVTDVGVGTFVDPRIEGGRVNARTQEDYVQIVELAGKEWLFYPRMAIDGTIIRATTADERGT